MRRRLLVSVALLGVVLAANASAQRSGGTPVALVTSESQNELLAVSLPDGHVLRRIHLPADPENVSADVQGPAVVVSARSHSVTLLSWRSLRVLGIFRGFANPHLAAIAPGGDWAYVTDDGTGELSVISLRGRFIADRVFVGMGAHHLAFSPFLATVWVALGEHARTIVVLNTTRVDHPRVLTRFDPGFAAHDLAFNPNGSQVWVTSDSSTEVTVFSTRTRQPLFRVPAGPPPQHVAFGEVTRDAYVTSGYGSRIEMVSGRGRVLRVASLPYGSFNVATADGLVVTSSLLRGTVTELTDRLQRWQNVKIAPAARDVAISVW